MFFVCFPPYDTAVKHREINVSSVCVAPCLFRFLFLLCWWSVLARRFCCYLLQRFLTTKTTLHSSLSLSLSRFRRKSTVFLLVVGFAYRAMAVAGSSLFYTRLCFIAATEIPQSAASTHNHDTYGRVDAPHNRIRIRVRIVLARGMYPPCPVSTRITLHFRLAHRWWASPSATSSPRRAPLRTSSRMSDWPAWPRSGSFSTGLSPTSFTTRSTTPSPARRP